MKMYIFLISGFRTYSYCSLSLFHKYDMASCANGTKTFYHVVYMYLLT